ncbi:LemA family protein [Novosphingobium sp.]|uniref:LemA family protein n=1 Tax=Novosphingobium sp. TaxID=1874826 RepID=UPI0025DA9B21|nr:LemA family protein [Novosphingobium sp.]
MIAFLLILLVVIAALIAAPGMIWVSTNNRLVALDTRCDTAFADIDAHLKHRQNLIPALVETVRGYAKHEAHILDGITQARVEAMRASAPDMKLKAEKNLTQQINALLGVADRYPDLKASGHFAGLRDELIDAENRITASRRFYNLAVGEYDTTLRQFPGSLIAQKRNMSQRKPFDLGFERVLIDEPMAIAF